MSKIHEALKRVAREGKRRWDDEPLTPGSGAAAEKPAVQQEAPATEAAADGPSPPEERSIEREVPAATPDGPAAELPPPSFDHLRTYRLEASERIVTLHESHSLVSEQFRMLRTRIQRQAEEQSRQVILVTSAGMGEGKTFISVNLALSLAQEVESRILLVDCDMRKPTVSSVLGLGSGKQPGLKEFISGEASLEKAMWRLSKSRLHVIGSGALPDNPSELLSSPIMSEAIAYLRSHFDVVVLDSPPILPVADPSILMPMVDGVVVVVRYGRTGRGNLDKAMEIVPEEKMLGLVFNDAMIRSTGYYYQYKY